MISDGVVVLLLRVGMLFDDARLVLPLHEDCTAVDEDG